jgi:hypothetical protein
MKIYKLKQWVLVISSGFGKWPCAVFEPDITALLTTLIFGTSFVLFSLNVQNKLVRIVLFKYLLSTTRLCSWQSLRYCQSIKWDAQSPNIHHKYIKLIFSTNHYPYSLHGRRSTRGGTPERRARPEMGFHPCTQEVPATEVDVLFDVRNL